MLKRLRIGFVAFLVAAVAVVLAGAFTVVCYADWHQSKHDADLALDAAIMRSAGAYEPGARMGGPAEAEGEPGRSSRMAADEEKDAGAESPIGDEPGIRSIHPATEGGRPEGRPVPQVLTAVYKQEGDTLVFQQGTSDAMWVPEAGEPWAAELCEHPDGTGTVGGDIYFMKKTLPEGCFIALMHDGPLQSWKDLAATLAWVGAAVLGVFLLIGIGFSRWALRPVEAAWAQQQRFVADASHDLKTPLSVVLANTAILLDEPAQPAEERRKWLESTRDEALGMEALVQDLLDSARTQDGAPKAGDALAAGASADLSRIAAKEALQFESVAFERQLTLDTAIEEGICATLAPEDGRRLVQVLLDNACKYADEGGQVTLALTADGAGSAQLVVGNSGPGIDAADLPRIFDRFYRADQARTSHQGHGLGLAIARSIAEAAGGTIAATSRPGCTRFTVRLPVSATIERTG